MPRNIVRPSTAGVFNGTTQYLSVADNATLRTGTASFWCASWVRLTSKAANAMAISKCFSLNTADEYAIFYSQSDDRFRFSITDNTSTPRGVSDAVLGSPVLNQWYFILGYWDSVTNTVGISVNGGAFTTASAGGGTPRQGTNPLFIGRYSAANALAWPGNIAASFLGKDVPGGFATTSAATIAAALYNLGYGLRPSELTAAQVTAWGVVSGWLDNGSLTADAIDSNTLTNANTTTLSLTSGPFGIARTAASNRNVVADVKTLGNFDSSLTQYLSVADNASLSLGSNTEFWISSWVNFATYAASQGAIVAKGTSAFPTTTAEYLLFHENGTSKLRFWIANGVTNTAVEINRPTVATWAFVLAWYDSALQTINISINNGSPASTAWTGGTWDSTNALNIGRQNAYYHNGKLSCVCFGKSPVGGMSGAVSSIATALYNNGNGLQPSKITAAQRTAWGVVSGWIDAGSLTADQIGSNTLTNNNTVTATSGYFRGGAS